MVSEVRKVYSGPLTCDMHFDAIQNPQYFSPGSEHLWEDLDLDVVGISGFFSLTPAPPQ